MRVRGWLAVVLGLLIFGSACAAPASPTPTVPPQPAPAVDYREALAALDTYRVQATLRVYPDPDTGLENATLKVTVEAINRPTRARRTLIEGLKSMARPQDRYKTSDVLKFVEVGGDLYVSTGTTWLKTPAQNDPEQGILDPALLVPDPALFTLEARGETINGVRADRYRFHDAAALAYLSEEERAAITQVDGQMWLAQDGQYIVRYRATAEGTGFRFAFSPEPFPGKVEVAYDVLDANAPLTIQRPQEALGESPSEQEDTPIRLEGFDNVTFPTPADASVRFQTPLLAVFDTRLSVSEVARFYANALPALGWTLQTDGETRGGVRQVWARNGYELRLTIVPDRKASGLTHVTVGVNPPSPE